MRKILLMPLIFSMVAFLPTLWMPAVHATPLIPVAGTLEFTYYEPIEWKWNGPNYFEEAIETEAWEGSFEGKGESVFRWTWFNFPYGGSTIWLQCTFTGLVHYGELDLEGTMVIQIVGIWSRFLNEWDCQWVITSGTDGLANLHGEGTWWGSAEWGAAYEGQIHLD